MCAATLGMSRLIPKKARTLEELVAATDYGMPKAMAGAHALPRCPEERSRINRSDRLVFRTCRWHSHPATEGLGDTISAKRWEESGRNPFNTNRNSPV
jgi:hypothetical protein